MNNYRGLPADLATQYRGGSGRDTDYLNGGIAGNSNKQTKKKKTQTMTNIDLEVRVEMNMLDNEANWMVVASS